MAVRADQRVLARIGFAQRWLDRAKDQCTEGNLTRGVLTLVLADAEVHQAMEAAGGPVRAVRQIHPAAVLVLGVVLSAALLFTAHRPMQSSTAAAPTPSAERLSSPLGTLPTAMGGVPTMSGSVWAPSSVPARATHPATLLASPFPDKFQASVQKLDHSRPSLRTGSSHITMPELIDLVLTAERALRADPAGRLSP